MNPVGNKRAREKLLSACRANCLGHSLLFVGREGIGKYLYALEFAGYLLCCEREQLKEAYGGCGRCRVCRLIRSGSCPELVTVDCRGEGSSTEKVREVISELYKGRVASRKRVVIFRDVECVKAQGANALLKSIEEPPADTYFILTTSAPDQVLPTVRSRCQRWHFSPLSTCEVKEILQSLTGEKPSPYILALSGGSASAAVALLEEEGLIKYIFSALRKIAEGNSRLACSFASELAKRDDKEEVFRFLTMAGNYFLAKEGAKGLLSLYKWAQFTENCCQGPYFVKQRNINFRYFLQYILTSLSSENYNAPAVDFVIA